MLRSIAFFTTLTIVASLSTGCNPCDELDKKICNDLGEADCEIWRDNDRPAFVGTGRKAQKSCGNALLTGYDQQLSMVKTVVDAFKSSGAAAPAAKGDDPSTENAPLGDAKPSENCTALETKLCTALADGCSKWTEAGKPGLVGLNDVQCKMATKPGLFYDKALAAAQASTK